MKTCQSCHHKPHRRECEVRVDSAWTRTNDTQCGCSRDSCTRDSACPVHMSLNPPFPCWIEWNAGANVTDEQATRQTEDAERAASAASAREKCPNCVRGVQRGADGFAFVCNSCAGTGWVHGEAARIVASIRDETKERT